MPNFSAILLISIRIHYGWFIILYLLENADVTSARYKYPFILEYFLLFEIILLFYLLRKHNILSLILNFAEITLIIIHCFQ